MSKIKQNKITFTLILSFIIIIFSSLTFLSLPVLFNYKSKVTIIEKKFYENFKFYLSSKGIISYKPFPKPHLIVENAELSLTKPNKKNAILNTSNLKIFISLKDLYLRSFDNLISTEIVDSNFNLNFSNIKELRNHLYQKTNKPIFLNNCKIFIRNKNNEVILISPVIKASNKINNKTKIKNFLINGKIFGLNFKSEWKKNYLYPKISSHNIKIYNPNIEIKNLIEYGNSKNFKLQSQVTYGREKLIYDIKYDNFEILISSPDKENTNFNIISKFQFKPFYFEGELTIKNKKVEKIIDNLILNTLFYDENYLGNLNGVLKIKFDELKNRLLKKGEIEIIVKEKKINLQKAKFNLHKIGYIISNMNFVEDDGSIVFTSKNRLKIENHIEFAKNFHIESKKAKKIKYIDFDLLKNIGDSDFMIKNVKINNIDNIINSDDIFIIKNIQSLRAHIRKVID